MKNLWPMILVLLLAFAWTPASAEGADVYILIGASNANDSVASGFAARRSELTGREAFVVNCSQAGSGLVHWREDGALYGECLAKYQAEAWRGDLRGVVFVNGEYEARYGGAWAVPFGELVAALRRDLGNEYLPMAFARVHPRMPGFFTKRVWQEQTDFYAAGVSMVVTDDLYLRRRSWHYLSAESLALGKRLAEALPSP